MLNEKRLENHRRYSFIRNFPHLAVLQRRAAETLQLLRTQIRPDHHLSSVEASAAASKAKTVKRLPVLPTYRRLTDTGCAVGTRPDSLYSYPSVNSTVQQVEVSHPVEKTNDLCHVRNLDFPGYERSGESRRLEVSGARTDGRRQARESPVRSRRVAHRSKDRK